MVKTPPSALISSPLGHVCALLTPHQPGDHDDHDHLIIIIIMKTKIIMIIRIIMSAHSRLYTNLVIVI